MQSTDVTIPNGGTLSDPIDCQEYVPVALLMPDGWDAAAISFQAAHGANRPTNLIVDIEHDGTGGTINIDVAGQNDDVAFDASASTVQTAIEGLSTVEVGDIAVTALDDGWRLEFLGLLAGRDAPEVTVDFASLTGETTATATEVQSGSGPLFRDVFDAAGDEMAATVDADRHVVLAPDGLRSARWLRLRSGLTAVPVAQTPGRTIGVVLVSDVGS